MKINNYLKIFYSLFLMNKKCIIVTYISNSRDIKGVLLLNYNFKKLKSKYKFACIVTENVSDKSINLLEKNNIIIFKFNLNNILKDCSITDSHINKIIDKHLFGKFCIFKLSDYDTILYLDTDTLPLTNIDHLLEKNVTKKKIWMVQDMQASSDYNSIILIKDRYNSGVIIAEPSEYVFNNCFKLLCDEGEEFFNSNIFISDQYIFEKLNNENLIDIQTLELKYNMHPILIESTYKLKMTDKVYILHYMTQPKPWDLYNLDIDHTFENTQCAELFKLWLHLYNEMIEIKYFSLKKNTNISGYYNGFYENNILKYNSQLLTKFD